MSSPIDIPQRSTCEEYITQIDLQQEKLITFREAANIFPCRRQGRKTAISTIFRWATRGSNGVLLESLCTPSGRVTSVEALQRFFNKLTAKRSGECPPTPRHSRKANNKIEDQLRKRFNV